MNNRRQRNDEKQKPVHSLSVWTGSGNIEVAVFEHKKDDRTDHSITFHRSYKDDQGNWQRTNTLFPRDLLPLTELLRQAWAFVTIREQS